MTFVPINGFINYQRPQSPENTWPENDSELQENLFPDGNTVFDEVITRLRNFMQEFLVKYAHKYAQKSTKICKNVLKYALNMQKKYF